MERPQVQAEGTPSQAPALSLSLGCKPLKAEVPVSLLIASVPVCKIEMSTDQVLKKKKFVD